MAQTQPSVFCCVYSPQPHRRGSTFCSSATPPVGRLGRYEIKGLLLCFLHIVKTLSEGGRFFETIHAIVPFSPVNRYTVIMKIKWIQCNLLHSFAFYSLGFCFYRHSEYILDQDQPPGHSEFPQLAWVSVKRRRANSARAPVLIALQQLLNCFFFLSLSRRICLFQFRYVGKRNIGR